MVRFKIEFDNTWVQIQAQSLGKRLSFENYMIDINGTVFEENSEEFRVLLQKELMWETLNGQI